MSDSELASVNIEYLDAFADAWNRHDIEGLMEFMTPDCIYDASVGPHIYGMRYEGAFEVREGFSKVLDTFPDAHWGSARHFIAGDRGVSEWIFTGTTPDGTKIEVDGCDVFTFKDGKIWIKNSYRKFPAP